jgi:hypothetical protein
MFVFLLALAAGVAVTMDAVSADRICYESYKT